MKNLQLSSKPPRYNQNLLLDEKAKEFVLGAEKNKKMEQEFSDVNNKKDEPHKVKTLFPWEDNNVRKDVYKTFNLRLPEEYYVKLAYLSQLKKDSKHKVCLDILLPEIDKKLNLK